MSVRVASVDIINDGLNYYKHSFKSFKIVLMLFILFLRYAVNVWPFWKKGFIDIIQILFI